MTILSGAMALGNLATGNAAGAAELGRRALLTGGAAGVMWLIDWSYNRMVAAGRRHDGIVPVRSQRYPERHDPLFEIPGGADSHVGATSSQYVRERLQRALIVKFRMDPVGFQ